MFHRILPLVYISCVSGLDYLLVGYNYADVCCDVTKVTAVEIQYDSFTEVPKILTPLLIDNAPISDFTENKTTVTAGTQLRIRLTRTAGFVIGHWYVVCFGTVNDIPGHCSLFRPCDCKCTEKAWVRLNITVQFVSSFDARLGANLFRVGFDWPRTISFFRRLFGNQLRGVKTPIFVSSTTKESYDSCSEYDQVLMCSNSVSLCKSPSRVSAYCSFPGTGFGTSQGIGENVTDMVGWLDIRFDVNKIPPPFTMVMQTIGVYTLQKGQKRKFTHYTRIVGDPVNAGEIDFQEMKQICEEIVSNESEITDSSTRQTDEDSTVAQAVITPANSDGTMQQDWNSAMQYFSTLNIFVAVIMLCR